MLHDASDLRGPAKPGLQGECAAVEAVRSTEGSSC